MLNGMKMKAVSHVAPGIVLVKGISPLFVSGALVGIWREGDGVYDTSNPGPEIQLGNVK